MGPKSLSLDRFQQNMRPDELNALNDDWEEMMGADGKIEVFSFWRPFQSKEDSIAPFKATDQYLKRYKLKPVEGSGEMVLVSGMIDGERYEPQPKDDSGGR